MNILMLHPHDITSSSEPWTVRIMYIAKEFVKRGHTVKLIYFPLDKTKQGCQELASNLTAMPLVRSHGPIVLIRNILRVYNLARRADIIHLQKCFYHAALPALCAAVFRNKPIHYDWDDWELKIFEVSAKVGMLKRYLNFFMGFLESTVPKICDTISVASECLRNECLKLGIESRRIFEAHVGADLIHFRPGISGDTIRKNLNITKPLVLYLGQLHGGQYVELFIRSAVRIKREFNNDVQFMIVGDGYMAAELKKMCSNLNISESIIFTGAISHELVPEYIAAADVCVACFEQNDVTKCKSPLKIAEYMASGKAIVASNVGEVPRMLDGAGVLVYPGDDVSLAAGISKVLSDKDLKFKLEKLARLRAEEKYNWSVTAEHIINAYKLAIKYYA